MRFFRLLRRKTAAHDSILPSTVEKVEKENRHFDRYKIIPALAETDRLAMEWHPYIMRRSPPCHRSETLNTDDFGFRCCALRGSLIGYSEVLSHAGPVGLISGNSTAFGIGASCDARTVASVMNESISDTLWYNVAHRAANFTQERINLDMYAPQSTQYVVFLSGANNLIVTLLDEGGERFCPPFVGEPKFLGLNRGQNKRARTLEERYNLMMESTSRDFYLLGQKLKATNLRCLFLLQPLAAWCERTFSEEERELIDIWDAHSSLLHQVHSPESLAPWKMRYAQSIRNFCEDNGVDFIDLNMDRRFLRGGWVFADRIHLADEGHRIVSEIIKEWLKGNALDTDENRGGCCAQ